MQAEKSLLFCVLEMVDANGGSFDSRKRLQKSAYLLKEFGVPGFSILRFDFGPNGPSSREVSGALHDSVVLGYLAEEREQLDEDQFNYLYHLTALGKSLLASSYSEQQVLVRRAFKAFASHNYDVLELSSIAIFLFHMNGSENRQHAFHLALERKPHYIQYQAEAKRLFSRITKQRQTRPANPLDQASLAAVTV